MAIEGSPVVTRWLGFWALAISGLLPWVVGGVLGALWLLRAAWEAW